MNKNNVGKENKSKKLRGEAGYSQLSDDEINELKTAFYEYCKGDLHILFGYFATISGLVLATLSALSIHPLANLAIVGLCAAIILIKAIYVAKEENPLSKILEKLRSKYPPRTANHDTTKQIDYYDIFNKKNINTLKYGAMFNIMALFIVYAAVAHIITFIAVAECL